MQRRLVNALQDLNVQPDGTVRIIGELLSKQNMVKMELTLQKVTTVKSLT